MGGNHIMKRIKYIIVVLLILAIPIGGYLVYTFADTNEYMAVSEKGYWRGVVFTLSADEDYKYGSDLAVIYQGNKDGNLGENVDILWYRDENEEKENRKEATNGCGELYERQNINNYLWNTINKKYFYWESDGEIEPERDKKITIEIEWKENGKTCRDIIYLNMD